MSANQTLVLHKCSKWLSTLNFPVTEGVARCGWMDVQYGASEQNFG
jgi:hypothetical protein